MIGVIVTGNRDIDRRFQTLPRRVQRKVLRSATRKAAKPVLETAKTLVRMGETRKLKRSLKIRAMKRSRRRPDTVGVRVMTGKEFFQGETFYGAFQEFGWKAGKRGRPNRRQIEGEHYLEGAYDRQKNHSRDILIREIGRGVEQEARR